MTKRRYLEDPPEPPQRKRSAPGPFAFAFALMFGVALALTADTHADPRSAYVQVTTSISNSLRTWTGAQPTYVTLRMGDWPNQLLTLANHTLSNLPSIDETPAIAVVIDDLGGDVVRTNAAIALPANVTLSFLPYPQRSLELSRRAHLAGHEVIVHLPMQPMGGANPGDRALKVGLPSDELQQRLGWALSRVSDYDGINNHMGSRFTASRADLVPIMRELKGRGLFFLDSRTTEKTQVEGVAREAGVLTGSRDIFIDGERSAAAIARQLALIEDFARKSGNVIAIGHPYPETLNALSKWTKTIKERGFRLAPLREVLLLREAGRPALVTAGISLTPAR
jgi:polysaccharide deacetylase 2 family uncharacterized protein YibQ